MSAVFPTPFQSGFRTFRGEDLNALFDFPNYSTEDTITAHAGGGQTSAYQLTAQLSRITVVAAVGDSIKLPVAKAGSNVWVINSAAANAMQVYGNGTDTINGIATAVGVTQAAGTTFVYSCTTLGKWITNSGTQSDVINTDTVRVTAETDFLSTTTLANVTGLSVPLTTSGIYSILAQLPSTSSAGGGVKYALQSTNSLSLTSLNLTASLYTATGVSVANTTSTTLGNALGTTAAVIMTQLAGTAVVNAGGTLVVQASQNASTATTTAVLVNGFLQVTRIA